MRIRDRNILHEEIQPKLIFLVLCFATSPSSDILKLAYILRIEALLEYHHKIRLLLQESALSSTRQVESVASFDLVCKLKFATK